MTQPTKEPAKWMREADALADEICTSVPELAGEMILAFAERFHAAHAPASVDGEVVGLLEEYRAEQQGFADQIISPRRLKDEYLERVARIRTTLAKLRGQG